MAKVASEFAMPTPCDCTQWNFWVLDQRLRKTKDNKQKGLTCCVARGSQVLYLGAMRGCNVRSSSLTQHRISGCSMTLAHSFPPNCTNQPILLAFIADDLSAIRARVGYDRAHTRGGRVLNTAVTEFFQGLSLRKFFHIVKVHSIFQRKKVKSAGSVSHHGSNDDDDNDYTANKYIYLLPSWVGLSRIRDPVDEQKRILISSLTRRIR